MTQPRITNEYFADLFSRNLIPLRVVVGAIAVGFYDYLLTLDDEVKYVWKQKRSLGRLLFFWIRYYTLVLLLFDLLQIHTFAIRGVANAHTCVLIDPITRLAGAISLWSVQIYMQLRIFALYNRSKKVALFNGVVFIFSIGFFLWIMVLNAMHRGQMIAHALNLPLPGCPTINGGFQWALWIPPSIFEFMLFLFALFKAVTSSSARLKVNDRPSLTATLLGNNMLYFLSVVVLLIFNNLMSVASTHIPWFGMAPFHAILGIVTGRIIIAFYKFTDETTEAGLPGVSQPLSFVRSLPPKDRTSSTSLANSDVESQQNTTDMDTYPNSESEDDTDDPTTPMLRSAPASDIEAGHRSRNGSWTSSAPSPIRTSYSGARRGSLLQSCPTPGPSTRRQSIV